MGTNTFEHIKNRYDLSDELNIPVKSITKVLYSKNGVNNFYKTFYIPKKDGSKRTINAPINELKKIQLSLKNILMKKYSNENLNSNIQHGFIKSRSIITNAKIHKNKKLF